MSFTIIEQIILLIFLICSLGYFGYQIWRRVSVIMAAKPDSEHEAVGKRVWKFISEVIFQSKVIADRPIAGLMHALVFWGFITYAIVTVSHFLLPFGLDFLHGEIGEIYRNIVVVFSILVLAGIIYLAIRRYIFTPKYFEHKTVTSFIVAVLITVLMLTFLFEPYIGDVFLAKANWWIHAASILIFLVIIPHSKHLHLVIGPFDLAYMRKTFGFLPALDIEELDEDSVLGVGSAAHMSREMRMDAFSCVECGRCTENCPANQSDKILDPRSMIHNFEKPLLAGDEENAFETEIISSEAVWQCVTCGACEHFCPLGIQHLPLIQQYRRNLTLEQGEIPQQMQNAVKSLTNKQNVWNAEISDRGDFIEELGLPVYEKGMMLFWSSCFIFTDKFRPKIKQIVDLLTSAGLNIGLSPQEVCCGDPARKCGAEDTYQELAYENIEWMKENGVTTVVSHCPHCLQTIMDGYKQIDPEFEVTVIHHTQLLAQLLSEGKLRSKSITGSATIHDPCYVSRWGFGDMMGMRAIASGSCSTVAEMKRSKQVSFCCGSGGGAHHFFEDEDQKRIDTTRVAEIVDTGAETVITACPFCFDMVDEGLKTVENNLVVEDLSALLTTK